MAVISGAAGAIKNGAGDFATVADWTITPSIVVHKPIASNTKLAAYATNGNADWMFKARAYGKVPPALPGDSISLIAYTGGSKYTGTCLVGEVQMTANIATGAPLVWDIQCGGDSALVRASSTAIVDAAAPIIVSAAPCMVKWAGTQVANVQQYTLKLSKALKPYAPGGGIIRRIASGVVEAGFTIDQLEGDVTAALVEGDTQVALFYVDATTYWSMTYGDIESSEQNVQIETGEIVPMRYTGTFSGWKTVTGAGVQGAILKPGGATFW